MLPTFRGRYETRLFLTLFIGVPVTLIYAFFIGGLGFNAQLVWALLGVLLALFIVGAILDPLYIVIQWLRWDRDWPFAYQFFFTIIEFGIVIALASIGWIPWLNEADFQQSVVIRVAIWHFFWVFLVSFLLLLGPLGVFFVRWRYKGGEFGRH